MSSAESPRRGSSPIVNFLKAIALVIVAIILLRIFLNVVSWLFGIIFTVVIVLVIGALIFRVIGALKKS
jgi:hypothetical protein